MDTTRHGKKEEPDKGRLRELRFIVACFELLAYELHPNLKRPFTSAILHQHLQPPPRTSRTRAAMWNF